MFALILRGLPASGKTSYALSQVALGNYDVIICRDDIRRMIYSSVNPKHCDEKLITSLHTAMLNESMIKRKHIIIAGTNLNNRWLKLMMQNIADHGYVIEIKDFEVPLIDLVERDMQRPNPVGYDVIMNMAKRYKVTHDGKIKSAPSIMPKHSIKPYMMPKIGLDAVVFDIDGTLAKKSDRSPYDFTRVMEDTLIEPVADCLEFESQKNCIFFLSGREETCRKETVEWLCKNLNINKEEADNFLFMRAEKDNRPDYLVKSELFDKHLSSYRIHRIYDDRNSVVSMWRSKGLTCFQVAPGNF